jgi:hypothetical protein
MRLGVPFNFVEYLGAQASFARRLLVELLPGSMLLPFVFALQRRRQPLGTPLAVLLPLVFYAGLGVLALLFWPGARPRYAMPAAPGMAVLAGFSIDLLWRRSHMASRLAVATLLCLIAYRVTLVTIVNPLFAERFGATRSAGRALAQAVAAAPAPVLTMGGPHTNQLFYVERPIRRVDDPADAAFAASGWLLVPADEMSNIEKARPDLSFDVRIATQSGRALVGARIEPRR